MAGVNAVVKGGGEQYRGISLALDAPLNDLEGWVAERWAPTVTLTNGVERMMFRDRLTYLPDDILCKVDRAAMSISLKLRVPFLHHWVAELARRMQMKMKMRDERGA